MDNQYNNGLETSGVIQSKMPLCDNITDTVIQIPESKARLAYRDHLQTCNADRFIGALSLLVTFVVTLLTSSFENIFGIEDSKYFLEAIFWIFAIGSAIATIVFLIQWQRGKKENNEDAFIKKLKGNKPI